MNEIEISKIELDIMMRGCTERLENKMGFSHVIGIAQIMLLALILWRIW